MNVIDQNLIKEVYNGNKMLCFKLLAHGIENRWFSQIEPNISDKSPDNIPLLISQYWHHYKIPEEVEDNISLLKKFNPQFNHYIACDESARSFIHECYGSDFVHLFDHCFHTTMRSDFWRICWLYEHGGIYVDVDTKSHASLTNIMADAKFNQMLTYAIGRPWCINNGFIVTTPKSELILEILKGQVKNITRFISTGKFENVWVETGPGITTVATMKWLAKEFLEKKILPINTGLVFRHYNAVAEAFHDVDMKYKSTAEGNWRMI